jgi:hypothetical protein
MPARLGVALRAGSSPFPRRRSGQKLGGRLLGWRQWTYAGGQVAAGPNAARGLMSVASRRSQRAARRRSARRWRISSQPR